MKDEGQVAVWAGTSRGGKFELPLTASTDGKVRAWNYTNKEVEIIRIPYGKWQERKPPEHAHEAHITPAMGILATYSDHAARLWAMHMPVLRAFCGATLVPS